MYIHEFKSRLLLPRQLGRALQTRDGYVKNGIPKDKYIDKPKVYYRTVYVVDKNDREELAIVKSTTKKGHFKK